MMNGTAVTGGKQQQIKAIWYSEEQAQADAAKRRGRAHSAVRITRSGSPAIVVCGIPYPDSRRWVVTSYVPAAR